MNRYKTTFETWNKVAHLYQEKFMGLDLYNDTYDLFCAHLKEQNPQILEIGCGPGNITKYMLTKRPDFKISGIDISANMIELAKTNNPEAQFRVMDIRNIHQLNEKYQGIICGFCLPYISKPEVSLFIANTSNLLSPNGILYLSFVAGDYKNSGYMSGSSGDKTYFYYHSLATIKRYLHQNRFQIIDIIDKKYKKNDGQEEIHTIVLANKMKDSE